MFLLQRDVFKSSLHRPKKRCLLSVGCRDVRKRMTFRLFGEILPKYIKLLSTLTTEILFLAFLHYESTIEILS